MGFLWSLELGSWSFAWPWRASSPSGCHARSSLLCVLPLLCFVLCFATSAHAQKAELTEYDLKAAFLYRFAKYIEWPAEAFAGTQTEFVLGILGEDPFGGAFDEAPTWKPINGRKFVV